MKNIIKFLIFIVYSTSVFFFPNNQYIFVLILIHLIIMLWIRKNIRKIIRGTLKIVPFIIFTFVINCWLDDIKNAIWIGMKLLLVCNMTMIYSSLTNVTEIAETIKILCTPIKVFKINTEEIKILVCISLSMIPILKKDLLEMKEACRAKNIRINIKNIKIILSKFFLSLLMRVNQIEEALIAKGQNY